MSSGLSDPYKREAYLAQIVNAQGAQISALAEAVGRLLEVVDGLASQVPDPNWGMWARNTIAHNRSVLAAGTAEAQAIVARASQQL